MKKIIQKSKLYYFFFFEIDINVKLNNIIVNVCIINLYIVYKTNPHYGLFK
jgi:hypothetical protein